MSVSIEPVFPHEIQELTPNSVLRLFPCAHIPHIARFIISSCATYHSPRRSGGLVPNRKATLHGIHNRRRVDHGGVLHVKLQHV